MATNNRAYCNLCREFHLMSEPCGSPGAEKIDTWFCKACDETHPGGERCPHIKDFSSEEPSKNMPKNLEGVTFIHAFGEGEEIKGMVLVDDVIIVATTRGMFKLAEGDIMVPILFAPVAEEG